MDREWLAYLKVLRGELVEMGGKGSGHHGHAGRKGKRGGSAPKGVAGAPPREAEQMYKLMHTYGQLDYAFAGPEKQELQATAKALGKVKAPGYGEWTELERTGVGGMVGTRKYSHPDHPEYGVVSVTGAGAAHAMRRAGAAGIEYIIPGKEIKGYRGWKGQGAGEKANRFLKKHWGI